MVARAGYPWGPHLVSLPTVARKISPMGICTDESPGTDSLDCSRDGRTNSQRCTRSDSRLLVARIPWYGGMPALGNVAAVETAVVPHTADLVCCGAVPVRKGVMSSREGSMMGTKMLSPTRTVVRRDDRAVNQQKMALAVQDGAS